MVWAISPGHFTIYDTDDQLKVIKTVMKEHNISDKAVTPKAVQNLISRSKDKLITPDKFSTKGKNGSDDYQLSTAKTIRIPTIRQGLRRRMRSTLTI